MMKFKLSWKIGTILAALMLVLTSGFSQQKSYAAESGIDLAISTVVSSTNTQVITSGTGTVGSPETITTRLCRLHSGISRPILTKMLRVPVRLFRLMSII